MPSLAAAGLVLGAAAASAAEPAGPDPALPGKLSQRIADDLARVDLDAFAADATKYIAPSAAERLRNNFASIKDLGQSQYSEMIYARDYGQNEKDIIYKIDFDKAFVYVRFLWHIDNANWHLIHISFKSEGELPFPKGWEHIYPR